MKPDYHFGRVFAAACVGMLLFGMVITTLGSILPSLIEKFDLSKINAGTLTSILPGGILAGSLIFGPLVDRYSYKYMFIFCGLIIMLGLQGIAMTDSLMILQISLAAIGLGGGALNGGANALVSDISVAGARSRSSNLSLLGVFFGIGALGMPFLIGILSAIFSSYQIINTVGFFLLIPIIYFLITRFPKPKQSHSVPLSQSLSLVRDPSLILLGMILFFQSGIEGIVSNWTTLYLESEIGMIKDQALFALSAFVLSLTVTRLLLTVLLNRLRPYQVLLFSAVLASAGIIILFSDLPINAIIGLVLLGAGLAAGFPVILGYVGAIYPNLSGTAFSIVLAIGLTGNILLNLTTGLVSNTEGIQIYPLLLMANMILLASLLIVTLKRISNKTAI